MKSIGTVLLAGIIFLPSLLKAQALQPAPDSIVQIAADLAGLKRVLPDVLLPASTYWLALPDGHFAPLPALPDDTGTVIYSIADGQYLVDDGSSGPLLSAAQAGQSPTSDLASDALAVEAAALTGLISQIQETAQLGMDDLYSGGANSPALTFTTNDLWLDIVDYTNYSATLGVHRPWNDTNLFHDLYYTESLEPPIQWQFIMRCPYTDVVVTDLCPTQGFFWLGPATNGNLTVCISNTPQQLAQMLVPPWVTVTNVTYTGAIEARGTFAVGNGCGLPLDTGVILATGAAATALGPNNLSAATTAFWRGSYNGDLDLEPFVGGVGGAPQTFDAAALEFDVVSTNALVLGFQYIFASEEWPEFIGRYNDLMAIFASTNRIGTNWVNSITNDFALVPGTTNVPVSVNNINGGCVRDYYGYSDSPTNSQYYVDNDDPQYSSLAPYSVAAPAFNTQYDGMTVLLTAQIPISANVTNHLKIVVADYGDALLDSAVFVKAWIPCQ